MFSAETIKKIGEVLHISDFDAKLKSEKEETLEVPVLITEDEKNTFGTNRFNEGKKAASPAKKEEAGKRPEAGKGKKRRKTSLLIWEARRSHRPPYPRGAL